MSYRDELKGKYYPEDYALIPDFRSLTLKLELTNLCNHSCMTCPHRKQTRQKGFMDGTLARRLIREAGQLGIPKAALFLNGESFLVKEIADYVALSKECGISYVFLTTNGVRATEQQLADVMHAGLDSLKFSVNGCDRQSYREVHGHDDFLQAIDRLRFAREYRDANALPCRILAGCVLTNGMKGRLEEYQETVGRWADELLFMKPDNFGGYMVEELPSLYTEDGYRDPRIYDFSDKRVPCPLVFNSINVTYEGYLTLCCSEALNYMVMEDLNHMTLEEAWSSERVVEIRRRHLRGELEGLQCHNCVYNETAPVEPMNLELFARTYQA